MEVFCPNIVMTTIAVNHYFKLASIVPLTSSEPTIHNVFLGGRVANNIVSSILITLSSPRLFLSSYTSLINCSKSDSSTSHLFFGLRARNESLFRVKK